MGPAAGGGAVGGMVIVFTSLAIAYFLSLLSTEVPLPEPRGRYYFKPNSTQALLEEGKHLDRKMLLAVERQKALATAEALQLGASRSEAAGRGFSVATADPGATLPLSLSYSRALMVYDLVFDESDEWLAEVVDRVHMGNKLFLMLHKGRGGRVSARTRERAWGSEDRLADVAEVVTEQQAAAAALEAKEEAALTAKGFLEAMVEGARRRQQQPLQPQPLGREKEEEEERRRSDEGLTEGELEVLVKLLLSHDGKGKGIGGMGRRRTAAAAKDIFRPVPVHVFFVAHNGTYADTHELTYLYAAMRYKTPLSTPRADSADGEAVCVDATFGFFKRPVRSALTANVTHYRPVPVLAVTAGAHRVRAADCAAHILTLPVFDVQSVTLMGTARVSPVVGGGGWIPASAPLPTPSASQPSSAAAPTPSQKLQSTYEYAETWANPQCQSGWAPTSTKVSVGSVCVAYAALSQQCGRCTEDSPVVSLCSRPRCSPHNASGRSGPCGFTLPPHSRRMAERMKGAMMGRSFPPLPPAVKVGMERFWAANEAMPKYQRIRQDKGVSPAGEGEPKKAWFDGWGRASAAVASAQKEREGGAGAVASALMYEYLRDAPEEPILLNCAEVSTSRTLLGPRNDALCREYAHMLLHREVEPGDPEAPKGPADAPRLKEVYPRSELTCVQSTDGFGSLHALIASEFPHIPTAMVRSADHYDMYPLTTAVRPVSLEGFRTRGEVLAALRSEGKGSSDRPSTASDVDDSPISGSVGASSRKLRHLFADSDLAKSFATRGRLKLTAEEVSAAVADLKAAAAKEPHDSPEDDDLGSGSEEGEDDDDDDKEAAAALSIRPRSAYYFVSWEQNEAFLSVEERDAFAKASYRYAVETMSAVVLNYFLRDDSRIPGRSLERW